MIGASGVPYFSQWESADLVPQFLDGRLSSADDPRWAESGARAAADYGFWAPKVCGLACLRMILSSRGLPVPPMMRLVEQALDWKVYIPAGERVNGLIYQPFAEWVRHDFGIVAEVVPDLTLERLTSAAAPAHASHRVGPSLDPLAGAASAGDWRSPRPGDRRGARPRATAQSVRPTRT